ncbi:subtilisin-like protease SBT5.3 [Euphorbia lathyris]|uniref:subtilisin-like protease SBT5.3 n=1 Tax=Euphorbia lathyris TaxID=212925 RepID=UPI0033142171
MRNINYFVCLCFVFYLLSFFQTEATKKKSYVVYLKRHFHGSQPSSTLDITDTYYELLGSCMKSKEKARESIFYSYTSYINGFAATLEDAELDQLSNHPEVITVFPNELNELHTTRSWEFLGLEKNGKVPADSVWRKARFGENVIIGNIDTGVWPESKSFSDEGMGPIPSKWKGFCDTNDGIKCNRKLIGARYFNKGFEASIGQPLNSSYNTARDTDGHGTHTLSTAGGRFVKGANLLGSANGTAKGGSPNARVASYKVCWPICFNEDSSTCSQSCTDADVLAAFDSAIHDGVDILSVSLGSRPRQYFGHGISMGSFHAVRNGILVVCSAGNSGPSAGTASNVAPWILTVAASTLDRDFPSNVILGNNQIFQGRSFRTNTLPAKKYYPIINSVDAKAANVSTENAILCLTGSLEPSKTKGKIVVCFRDGIFPDIDKSWVVAQAGGVGMILANQANSTITPDPHFLPTSLVSAADTFSILSYILSSKSPVAYISGGTKTGGIAAPVMASFSSSGPNAITAEILKPDITAPGVYILAAFTEASGPAFVGIDKRHLPFNILSGTSMSCPHVAGIAGLIKTIHPHWSPAAIKSAIMTSAKSTSNIRKPIATESLDKANPFNYGSGHIWPERAIDPGLVYDLSSTDYLNFLCSVGYNQTQISIFVEEPYRCPSANTTSLLNLNYPSITIPNLSGTVKLSRRLKNVGNPGVYRVRVEEPSGISVKVEPMKLKFSKINDEKSFQVTVKGMDNIIGMNRYVFGEIVWSDRVHNVRSPLVVKMAANSHA